MRRDSIICPFFRFIFKWIKSRSYFEFKDLIIATVLIYKMPNILFLPSNLKSIALRLLTHLFPTMHASTNQTGSPNQSISAPVESEQPASVPATKQEIPATTATPLEWFKGQPRDMSLVLYIDQQTTQIMAMLAITRRQAADLFRVPMYAGKNTRWQTRGPHRMYRMDFAPAQVFQEQEAALGELEGLLSARWYSSTELTNLDQAILRAFEASCTPDGAPVIGLPAAPDAITQLRQLLQSRAVTSEEAKRIDETLISSFQKIGVALPEPSPPAG